MSSSTQRGSNARLIGALPSVKSTADPLLALTRPKQQLREINSKSGSKIMTMRFTPKPSEGMPVGEEARRLAQEAKRTVDGVIPVSAAEVDGALSDARRLMHAKQQQEEAKSGLAGFGSGRPGKRQKAKAEVIDDGVIGGVGTQAGGEGSEVSDRALVTRYLRLLKSREAAALADRQEREEQYRLQKDAVKWRSVYQMHLHLATVGSSRYDPCRPLLDEPQRQHAESLARERRMQRKKLRLRRERNRRRRLRRPAGVGGRRGSTVDSVLGSVASVGIDEDEEDVLSSSDTDEEVRRRREKKRKGRQQRQATDATRAAAKLGPLGVLQTAMGPLVSYLQPPSSDDEDNPPWSEAGHGRLRALGVTCLPPADSDDESGPAVLPSVHVTPGEGGGSSSAGMSTGAAASRQAGQIGRQLEGLSNALRQFEYMPKLFRELYRANPGVQVTQSRFMGAVRNLAASLMAERIEAARKKRQALVEQAVTAVQLVLAVRAALGKPVEMPLALGTLAVRTVAGTGHSRSQSRRGSAAGYEADRGMLASRSLASRASRTSVLSRASQRDPFASVRDPRTGQVPVPDLGEDAPAWTVSEVRAVQAKVRRQFAGGPATGNASDAKRGYGTVSGTTMAQVQDPGRFGLEMAAGGAAELQGEAREEVLEAARLFGPGLPTAVARRKVQAHRRKLRLEQQSGMGSLSERKTMWWAQGDEDVVQLRKREKVAAIQRAQDRRMRGLPPEDEDDEATRSPAKGARRKGGRLSPMKKGGGGKFDRAAAPKGRPPGATGVLDFNALPIGFSMRLSAGEAQELFGMLAPALPVALKSTKPVPSRLLSRVARLLTLPPEMGRRVPPHAVGPGGQVSLQSTRLQTSTAHESTWVVPQWLHTALWPLRGSDKVDHAATTWAALALAEDEATRAAQAMKGKRGPPLALHRHGWTVDDAVFSSTDDVPTPQRHDLRIATLAYIQRRIRPVLRWAEHASRAMCVRDTGIPSAGDTPASDEAGAADEGGSMPWRELLVCLRIMSDPFSLPHQHLRWSFQMYGSEAELDTRQLPTIRLFDPIRRMSPTRTGWAQRAISDAKWATRPQLGAGRPGGALQRLLRRFIIEGGGTHRRSEFGLPPAGSQLERAMKAPLGARGNPSPDIRAFFEAADSLESGTQSKGEPDVLPGLGQPSKSNSAGAQGFAAGSVAGSMEMVVHGGGATGRRDSMGGRRGSTGGRRKSMTPFELARALRSQSAAILKRHESMLQRQRASSPVASQLVPASAGAAMMSAKEARRNAYKDPQAALRYVQLAEAAAEAKKRRKMYGGGGKSGGGWSAGAKENIDVSFKHWPGQFSRAARPKRTQAMGDAMMKTSILSQFSKKKQRKRHKRSALLLEDGPAGGGGAGPSATRKAEQQGLLEQGVKGPGGQGVMLSPDSKLQAVDEYDKGSRQWYPDVRCPTSAIAGMFGSMCGTGEQRLDMEDLVMGVQSLSVLPMPPPREFAYVIADSRKLHHNAEQAIRQREAVQEAIARTLEAAGKKPKDRWVLDPETGAYSLVKHMPPGLDIVAQGSVSAENMVAFDQAARTRAESMSKEQGKGKGKGSGGLDSDVDAILQQRLGIERVDEPGNQGASEIIDTTTGQVVAHQSTTRRQDEAEKIDLSVSTMVAHSRGDGSEGGGTSSHHSKRTTLQIFHMLESSLQNAGDDWGKEAEASIARSMGWKRKGARWVQSDDQTLVQALVDEVPGLEDEDELARQRQQRQKQKAEKAKETEQSAAAQLAALIGGGADDSDGEEDAGAAQAAAKRKKRRPRGYTPGVRSAALLTAAGRYDWTDSDEDVEASRGVDDATIRNDEEREALRQMQHRWRLGLVSMLRDVLPDGPSLTGPGDNRVSLVRPKADGNGLEPRPTVGLRDFDMMLCSPPVLRLLRPRRDYEIKSDRPACRFETMYPKVLLQHIIRSRDAYRKAFAMLRVLRRWTMLEMFGVFEQWKGSIVRRRHTRWRLQRLNDSVRRNGMRQAMRKWARQCTIAAAAERLQSSWRAARDLRMVRRLKPSITAAIRIQSLWRMHRYGKMPVRILRQRRWAAALDMQRLFRGFGGRRTARRLLQKRARGLLRDARAEEKRQANDVRELAARAIQRVSRRHMVKQRAREWREQLWQARRGEEAMQRAEEEAQRQAAVDAALAQKRLQDEITAIRAKEEADKHRLEVERQLRITQMRKSVQNAETLRDRERGEVELQVKRRIAEAKQQGQEDRKRRQSDRRRQIIKYIKDYALGSGDPTLREALTFLDNEAMVRPDAARGQFEWRNFSVGVDPTKERLGGGASADDASVIRAEELKFTADELREQEQIMDRIMRACEEEYQVMLKQHEEEAYNRRTNSIRTDAMVSSMAKLMSEELGKISSDESGIEQTRLREIAKFRKNELAQVQVRYQKALRPAKEEAVGIVQGAARVYLAKCDLARAIRGTYVKEWDEAQERFFYRNTVLGTRRATRPIIMGPYDVRARGMTRKEEEACKQRQFQRHGAAGAGGGEGPADGSHGSVEGGEDGAVVGRGYGSTAASFRPPPASAGQQFGDRVIVAANATGQSALGGGGQAASGAGNHWGSEEGGAGGAGGEYWGVEEGGDAQGGGAGGGGAADATAGGGSGPDENGWYYDEYGRPYNETGWYDSDGTFYEWT